MPEAYRAIEWRAIFLVAAVLPVGVAVEKTGAALPISDSITRSAGALGPVVLLLVLVLLSSLQSQGLDGASAVVLLAPVALRTAEQLGVSPPPVMMAVSLAASAAFMTPVSHKANLLVMGAGNNRATDHQKVGTPLTVFVILILLFLTPLFFPF
jgi:di/tricarboxylate transporter